MVMAAYQNEKKLESKVSGVVVEVYNIEKIKPIRFKFIPLQSTEVNNLLFDFESIEDFINEELKNHYFGNDVKEFHLLVHTYVFSGPFLGFFGSLKGKKGYKTSCGLLFATKDFDYSALCEMDEERQFEIVKGAIIEGIEDVKKIGARVRNTDFEINRFKQVVDDALTKYFTMVFVSTCEVM